MTSAKFSIDDYTSSFPLSGNLMPQKTVMFSMVLPKPCQVGSSYLFSIEAKYADKSISSVQSSLVAQAGETATPTPSSTPTKHFLFFILGNPVLACA